MKNIILLLLILSGSTGGITQPSKGTPIGAKNAAYAVTGYLRDIETDIQARKYRSFSAEKYSELIDDWRRAHEIECPSSECKEFRRILAAQFDYLMNSLMVFDSFMILDSDKPRVSKDTEKLQTQFDMEMMHALNLVKFGSDYGKQCH